MVANKHELIANAAMSQLHKMRPCTFDIEIPEAPAGWSWTMAQKAGEFEPVPARIGEGDDFELSSVEVITKDAVALQASLLRANISCLGVQ
ncbi:hypothetical protein [Aeromonas caviae]|uniref:hypothetical protein n=1 Tax=Aeromonas caviae TaxID=648 RepID=UPI0021D3B6A3|nr:hypothetical protein [Aeromonas caviae]MCU7792524.1 hypothetical protein [Aeromonas caviae]WEE21050.1 hypothetical protein PY772_18480 [Aeromonas caviae]